MIHSSWLNHLEAPPGFLLMIRDEVLEQAGGIFLPYGIKNYTRTGTGTVLSNSTSAPFEKGDRLAIVQGAGRRFVVGGWGLGDPQFEIIRIRPTEILAKSGHQEISNFREHYLRLYEGKTELLDDEDPRFDEGDRDGLR